jgi:hypothetical protein
MLLIIKHGEGDYEDYREYITHVFQINKKGLTGDMIESSYGKYMVDLMLEQGIAVHPNQPSMILHPTHQIDGKEPNREKKKIHKKLLKENPFVDYVIKNYKAKLINEVYDVTIY